MDIAVIKNSVCISAAVFDDIETAQQFLSMGVWPDTDTVVELPDGYGIGDLYDGETWTKAPQPEPPEPEQTLEQRVEVLEEEVQTIIEHPPTDAMWDDMAQSIKEGVNAT